MEDLIKLVTASLARHGVECPSTDSEHDLAVSRDVQTSSLLAVALPEHNFRKSLQGDPAP
jgi:hypothetical protein